MKIKLITKNVVFLIMGCVLFYSCEEDENLMVDSLQDSQWVKDNIEGKLLARVVLPEQITVSFIEEEDGVSYFAYGKKDLFNGLGPLNNADVLEIFLAVTDQNVAIPKALLDRSDDQKSKSKASKRPVIDKFSYPVEGKSLRQVFAMYKAINQGPDFCATPDDPNDYFNTYDNNGMYSRVFKAYPSEWGQNYLYSSGKSNGNKCKKLGFNITNCEFEKYIKVVTYKMNIWGNYKEDKTFRIPAFYSAVWGKEYDSYDRRVLELHRDYWSDGHFMYGGVLYFNKYK